MREATYNPAPHTILVHGFLRTRHDMFLMARRLRQLIPETSVHIFGYPSRKLTLREVATSLADFTVAHAGDSPVSFVGHSLGGLVVRALDAFHPSRTRSHRLVTLGSPHQGAQIAGFLSRSSIARRIGGPILLELAKPPLPASCEKIEVGCVIGVTNTRLGFLPVFGRDNDGLVCVDEAVYPSCAEEIRVGIFHGFFPFSARAAELSARFLSRGTFTSSPDRDSLAIPGDVGQG